MALRIVPLQPDHRIRDFRCGRHAVDRFFHDHALPNARSGMSKTFVALNSTDDVVGYYSLSMSSVAFAHFPTELGLRVRYPIPTVHLGKLGVDQRWQGQRLGPELLIDAICRGLAAAEIVGAYAFDVFSIDDAVRGFYQKFGFVSLLDDANHLFLPMSVARAVREATQG